MPDPSIRPALSVVVPAYNEESSVHESLTRLLGVLEGCSRDFEVLLVSDGSTDATVAEAERIDHPALKIHSYSPNRGKGYALKTGIEMTSYPLVMFADGDLDLDPSVVPDWLEILDRGEADGVVGSKAHPDSQVEYPWTRRVLSHVFRWLTRLLVGLDLGDTQTGMKIIRREPLAHAAKDTDSDGFAFDLELLVRLNDEGVEVVEAPIVLDFDFTSSVKVSAGLSAVGDLIRVSRWRRQVSRSR